VSRRTLSSLLGLFAFALGLAPAAARAHEMTMAELEMRELSKGQFVWTWGQSGTGRPIEAELTPQWPEGCAVDGQSLRCSAKGMIGRLAVDGIGKQYSAAIVRIAWLGGETRAYTLTTAQPSVQLYGGAADQRSLREIALAYTVLGVEHILGGIDHLLFVIGLLFLVGFHRKLIGTITAFTLAHSVTLACSVLGLITLRSPPVEACIALSIVLVASEALRARVTLTQRLPALVAFLFGLVHGLGFAGALEEIGLPEDNLPIALVSFNVGVEIGQLMTVAAAYALMRLLARVPWHAAARRPALYAIGIVAAYWSWTRIAAIGAL
jgi:hydrogenase/urease accessory protein HupE